jgi:hypothetical protein
MFNRHQPLSGPAVLAVMLLLGASFSVGAADAPSVDAGAGTWQPHQYQLDFPGFTTIYSCEGLRDKLRLLLRRVGARDDASVVPVCIGPYGRPDKLAQATMKFWTLQPAAEAAGPNGTASPTALGSPVPAVWRHVELAPNRPYELSAADCELMEQFRNSVLPMFTTRNVKSQFNCVPFQETGPYPFSMSFDVLTQAGASAPVANSNH